MKNIIRELEAIIRAGARHRRGGTAGELPTERIFNDLHCEATELYHAITRNEPVVEQRSEMGDVLAIVAHIIVLQGWTLDELEQAAIQKLRNRWSGYTPPTENGTADHFCPNEFCQHQRKEMARLYARVDFLEARLTEGHPGE